MTPKPIRVAVIGVGAFGKNHARVYRELQEQTAGALQTDVPRCELVGVVDPDAERASQVAAAHGAKAYSNLRELLANGGADAISIAVPTRYHRDVAVQALQAGLDVLIEKPIAATLAEADEIVSLAAKRGRIGQVGHLERFNPAVQATVPLLTQPMFFEVHRLSPFGPRALDVDVVLDLMIHDLDIVLSFVDSPVVEVRAVGLPILSSKVDIANVRLQFQNGCVANFTASRVSLERIRKLRFFQPSQYFSLDYARQDVLIFSVKGKAIESGGELQPPDVVPSKPPVVPCEPLKAEIVNFLCAIATRETPRVSLADGRKALAVALEITRAIEEHARKAKLGELQRLQ